MKKWVVIFCSIFLFILGACAQSTGDNDHSIDKNNHSTNTNNNEAENGESLDNVNKEGFPIVDEPINLKVFAAKNPQNAQNDWNDILIWNEYAEMTNINIEWDQIPLESLEEQRNLALSGGNFPDVFFLASIPPTDIFKYGQQGMFIELNDLIDEYAPNLKKAMEEYPEVRKAVTFPDGKIYSFPTILSPEFPSRLIGSRPWFSKETLKTVGMEVPETTDEFYEFLKATKELTNKTPYGGTSMDELVSWLQGAFDLGTTGVRNENIDVDPDDESKVRFYSVTDDYKELLEYIHRLFNEGLIEQNIFSIEWDQYLANASEGNYASTIFYEPVMLFGEEVGKDYVGATALEGPNGHKKFVKVAPFVNSISNFVITNENTNPEATVRWMDYFYSDEGTRFYYMGIEGETYEVTEDGEYVYTDNILNSPDGLTMEQEVTKYLTWVGNQIGLSKQEYFQGSENGPASLEAAEKIAPYVPEEIWPYLLYTEEEYDFLHTTGADINKYIEEQRDRFIYGSIPFSEWDDFVDTVEQMGLNELMEIHQKAYERYQEQ